MNPERRSNDTRIALLEQSFEGVSRTVIGMDLKLDGIVEMMAEARGAAKLGKRIGHLITAILAGGAGAASGAVTAAQKITNVVEQAGLHIR